MAQNIEFLVRSKRFLEALYFGALQIDSTSSSQLHLLLGVACCGTIKPIGLIERTLREPRTSNAPRLPSGGLIVGRATTIVYEGFEHLVEARRKDPSIVFAADLVPIVSEVVDDLVSYQLQEFHGYTSDTPVSLPDAALAATVLLVQLTDGAVQLPPLRTSGSQAIAERVIEERLAMPGDGAAFHRVRRADRC